MSNQDFYRNTLGALHLLIRDLNSKDKLIDNPDIRGFIELSINDIKKPFRDPVTELFHFEKEKERIYNLPNRASLLTNHQNNINKLSKCILQNSKCTLEFDYFFNKDTYILKANYCWEDLNTAIINGLTPRRGEYHYFVRHSVILGVPLFENLLQDWNKLIIDFSTHKSTFSGCDIVSIIRETSAFDCEEKLLLAVSNFLAEQLAYFNSLIVD